MITSLLAMARINQLEVDTADYARIEGKDIDDLQLVFGVRAWF